MAVVAEARHESALAAFADRAVAHRKAERAAARTGCRQVRRAVQAAGLRTLKAALRCLARRRPSLLRAYAGRWRATTITLHGEINAARISSKLRAVRSGPRALAALAAGRAAISVRTGPRSRVTLRLTTPEPTAR